MAVTPVFNSALYKRRREEIITFIREENPDLKKACVILFANFENERYKFRQESSFYYLTGLQEPGAILCLYLDGSQILYLPNYGNIREKWTVPFLKSGANKEELAKSIGVTEIRYLGQPCGGFFFSPVFTKEKYENFLIDFDLFLNDSSIKNNGPQVFTILDNFDSRYFNQIQIYRILLEFFPALGNITRDLAPLVHYLRRFKSEFEIDLIYKAAQVTCMAHDSACKFIMPGRLEYEIQAIIESVFLQTGAMGAAFPSIVASGKNTTILHYTEHNNELKNGDLIVLDIGAEYGFYSSDITRTYPVNGKFTKRQLEVYNIVFDVQAYIESVAKPGMFLNNSQEPENSLQHLAIKFLEKKGYAKYFTHGIGHFLGLDVHDVGDNSYPLSAGDVFTIEPGIYIPEENLGIRIEDDYLMTDDGVVCLSFQLTRKADEIESLMKEE